MSKQQENDDARARMAKSRKLRRGMGLKEARVAVWVHANRVEEAREIMRDSVEHLRVYLEDEK